MYRKLLKEFFITVILLILLILLTAGVLANLFSNGLAIPVFIVGAIFLIARLIKRSIRIMKEDKNYAEKKEALKRAKEAHKVSKEKLRSEIKSSSEKEGFPRSQKLERIESLPVKQQKSHDVVIGGIRLHPDLYGLIWIGDGPHRNYNKGKSGEELGRFNYGGREIIVTYIMGDDEEPSLIYTHQEVSEVPDIYKVGRPPYYPSYKNLFPDQKWVYLNLLANPYDKNIDIGFVFILYYGLERHLLTGDFDRALHVILKLRDVHTNASFQSYSANALILSAMLRQRGDMVEEFIKSLDKEHEYNFSANLFLLCYYSFEKPINAGDIIRLAKTFGWTNMNYIKKQRELFLRFLIKEIERKRLGSESILLSGFLSLDDIKRVRTRKEPMFANMSIINEEIAVPQLANLAKLKNTMYALLEAAHEATKKELAERRKAARETTKEKGAE